ncbi:Mut7-C RNAse domain-containing protein [Gallaecimonas sp. GXIMD4217]|uniref:Mut7-C RNAse domain-containing protein n=1 Tax=Gallaecimonas sp. GXIMD4217 TaxID=3131927 RepID=UPI00311ABC22
MSPKPRFLADAMLGRLARWLRVLDYDTLYHPEKPDPELVAIADREERWLLTRDRALVNELRPHRSLLIQSQKPLQQLREVIDACQLPRPDALFRRCLLCNGRLRAASAEEIDRLAPLSSRQYGDELLYCPGCHRLYWPGSHTRRMARALARTLPHWFTPPG